MGKEDHIVEEEIVLERPRMPLEPIVAEGEPGNERVWADYNRLLAEYNRLIDIRYDQVKGASMFLKEGVTIYSPEEYETMLTAYRKERKAYLAAHEGRLETIEMVREKLRKLSEEAEKIQPELKAGAEYELPDPPEFEDIPDESWDDFKRRFEEHSKKMSEWFKKFDEHSEKSMGKSMGAVDLIRRRLEEMGKFPELEYELEKCLRYTYIDPKTGEQFYRPDDEEGEGLICLGSRDHKPILKDE